MNMQRPRRVSAGRAWGHGGSAPRGTVPEPRGGEGRRAPGWGFPRTPVAVGLGVLEAAEAVVPAGAEAWASEGTTAASAFPRPLLVNRAGGSVAMAALPGPPGHSSGGRVTVATRAGPGGWEGGGGTPLSLPPSSPVPPPHPPPPLPFASSPSGASSASRGCQGVGKQPRRGEEGRGGDGFQMCPLRCCLAGAGSPEGEGAEGGGGVGGRRGTPRREWEGGSGEEARGRQGRAARRRRRRRRHERVFPVPAAPVSHGSRAATPNRAWGSRPAPLQPPSRP